MPANRQIPGVGSENHYRFSIPFKLLLLLLPMVCLPIVIVGYWSHQISVDSVTRLSKEHQLFQAHEAALQIDSIFEVGFSTLGVVSRLLSDFSAPSVQPPRGERSQEWSRKIEILLHHIIKNSPYYVRLSLVEPGGEVLLDVARKNAVGPLERAGIAHLSASSGQPQVLPQIRQYPQSGLYYVQLVGEYTDSVRKSNGWMILELDFSKIIQMVRTIRVGREGYGFLVDKVGRTIAHPRYGPYEYDLTRYNDPRLREFVVHMLSGETGWMTFNELGEQAAAFAPVRATGWSMAVSVPIDEFKHVARVHRKNVTRVVVVMIIVSTLIVVYISFRIIRPMRNLVLATKQVAAGDLSMEIPVQSKDELGLLSESFNAMIRSLRDIQRELVASEKLISLGRLSAGVAHEIRNPLTAMKGAINYLQRRRPEDGLVMEYTGIIAEEVDRLNQFVSDFLLYAKQSEPRKCVVDVNELLQGVITLLHPQFAAGKIRVDFLPVDSLPLIEVDPRQLQQVLLNVFLNSVGAMVDGGRIAVTVHVQAGEEGACLVLHISDDGSGISSADLPYVFDPFYSTKDTGTGLGLPICLSIVENHGGRFMITPNRKKGVSVTIELPVERDGAQHNDRRLN